MIITTIEVMIHYFMFIQRPIRAILNRVHQIRAILSRVHQIRAILSRVHWSRVSNLRGVLPRVPNVRVRIRIVGSSSQGYIRRGCAPEG